MGSNAAAGGAVFVGTAAAGSVFYDDLSSGIAFAVGMAAAGLAVRATSAFGPLGRGLGIAWAYLEVAPAVELVSGLELDGGASLLGDS